MVTAALVSFAILLIAWVVAPSGASVATPDAAQPAMDAQPARVAASL